jgi:hypothetical protein
MTCLSCAVKNSQMACWIPISIRFIAMLLRRARQGAGVTLRL